MSRARHSVLLRTLALFVLLWVGGDIGAHGLVASDCPPIAGSASQPCVSQDQGGATECATTDHCFCHSLSTAATMPVPTADLIQVGASVLDPPRQVPLSHPQPLDRPPQLAA